MNKKGLFGFSVVMGIMFFMVTLVSVNFIMEQVTTVRASDALNCGNADAISDGTKLLCLGVDLVVPYFIALAVAIGGSLMVRKLV